MQKYKGSNKPDIQGTKKITSNWVCTDFGSKIQDFFQTFSENNNFFFQTQSNKWVFDTDLKNRVREKFSYTLVLQTSTQAILNFAVQNPRVLVQKVLKLETPKNVGHLICF